jgi:hypothetical protein
MLHHMATILVCYDGHFESKMAAKIKKSSDLGQIWFPSRFCSCELIIVIFLELGAINDPSDHIISCYYYSYYSSFFRINFVRPFSRRCLDQTLWNLVGISYSMWSCAVKCWFFQNGCRCHENGQNAKKLKKHRKITAGYSPNRNWWNLIGTTSTSSGTR